MAASNSSSQHNVMFTVTRFLPTHHYINTHQASPKCKVLLRVLSSCYAESYLLILLFWYSYSSLVLCFLNPALPYLFWWLISWLLQGFWCSFFFFWSYDFGLFTPCLCKYTWLIPSPAYTCMQCSFVISWNTPILKICHPQTSPLC